MEGMEKETTTVEIHGKICHIYKSGSRGCHENNASRKSRRLLLFYWGIDRRNVNPVMTVVSFLESRLKERMMCAGFILVAYESGNWNADYSPWKAQAVFGNEGFGGNADKTLEWLTDKCIPYIESEDSVYMEDAKEVYRFTVGYSLAGLFSLWAYSRSRLFAGTVCCSGSLWYEGWLDYVEEYKAAFCTNRRGHIYLSLGNKEEKTKNQLMSAVGDNTRKMYALLSEEQENITAILEWNAGGHFSEPDIRIAKGIYWILQCFVV